MRILRFSAFFLVLILWSVNWAQTTQPAPGQQPAATQTPSNNQSQPLTAAQPQSPTEDGEPAAKASHGFKLKVVPRKSTPDEKKFPAGTLDRGFRAANPQLPQLAQPASGLFGQLPALQNQPGRRKITPQAPIRDPFLRGDPEGELDRGIRINPDGANICGSIVSYNFSQSGPGEMPELESITTCTPANKIVPRRAEHQPTKPPTPRVIETAISH